MINTDECFRKQLNREILFRLQYVELLTHYESAEVVESLTYHSFLCFVREFKQSMGLMCRIEGMVRKEDAVKVSYSMERVRSMNSIGIPNAVKEVHKN